MVAPPIPKEKMTSEEFLALADHDTGYVELIEGVVYVMAGGASIPHQQLSWRFAMLLGNLVREGQWFHAPTSVKLDEINMPEPDIFWLAPGNPAGIENARVVGVPDLIIEILSRSTSRRDKGEKYAVYERNGVKEYWIVDPANASLDVFTLRDGTFTRHGAYAEGDSFDSPVLGRTVTLTGIFEQADEA